MSDEQRQAYEIALRTASFLMVASTPHPLDLDCFCVISLAEAYLELCYGSVTALSN